ncbi:BA14K family protein [Bradyrhizobium sp. Arg68]|uniref:BA14K family protein n=1 Tax=Bradyrhizobium ivorense TaxID=2511166 RepID=UPI001E4A63D6|nr:BA14K family protein [Bradyrhizobium ivorense]MCC8937632.1 BA14K family protein [Bradyrhizobium ivorense]
MKLGTLVVASITAGAVTLSTVVPSVAAPLAPARLQDQPTSVQQVQYRHYHGGGPRYGYRGGGYRGGYHHHGGGGNAGAVIGGLAVGAIIGGAIAASQAKANNDAYCSQRFRSYDPASGTYIASGGVRRPCP